MESTPYITLIRDVAPSVLFEGTNILVAGEKIAAFPSDKQADELCSALGGLPTFDVIDAQGEMTAIPGFVDVHVHLTGGGGEKGFASRTPEAKLSELIMGGITTVIGVLGTDSITKAPQSLLAKCQALNEEGLTAYMYTGSYGVPPVTITGSVAKDVGLIQQCIGLGEVAISDHRGSYPSTHELCRLCSEVRVSGMLSGKKGVVYFHMGSGSQMLKPLYDIIANSEIPITQLLPCHVNRSQELIDDAEKWLELGGTIDFTAGFSTEQVINPMKEILSGMSGQEYIRKQLILSSDAYGSQPRYNARNELIGYDYAKPYSLFETMKTLVHDEGWSLIDALPCITSTPSSFYQLKGKGRIAVGYDGDILLYDPSRLAPGTDVPPLSYVLARGQLVKTPDWVKKGMFE